MACSDVSVKGESLQIIRITSQDKNGKITHELELMEENFEKIMCHPDVKENPVQIVSIAGAFRKGKSFILGFFLRYLETQQLQSNFTMEFEWLSENDKIQGFQWRGGSDRVTTGIQIWSKPFVCENKFGEKIAVLLMDTQGVFDNESTVEDCASIFALSNLISSVQIYNIMQQLQEDDLQHLEFFTEFGKLVSDQSDETGMSNSRLIFLIRDLGFPYELPYGKDGGEAYIREKLKKKSNHHEELQRIRRNLNKCFPNIGGFLLPHPGKTVVTKQTYDGTVKEMDEEFVESVKQLIPYVLSRDILMSKRINGMDVTGEDMLKYVKAFVELLKTGEFPSPQTAFKAMTAVGRQLAINTAFELYKKEIDRIYNLVDDEYFSEAELEKNHERIKLLAIAKLKEIPRMQILEQEYECQEQLNILIEQKYNDLKKIVKTQNENLRLQKLAERKRFISYLMAVALIVCIIGYIVGPEYFQLIGKVALAGAHDLIDIFKTVVKSLGSTEKKM